MRTTHTLTATRALFISSALLIIAGLVFALAPLSQVAAARQALVARANANPTIGKILSLAPAPLRNTINKRLVPAAHAATVATSVMFAPVTITKDAVPPTGSAVGQGQVIVYNIQATNGASSDTTTGAGGVIVISDTAPAGTLFTNVTVQQQPQFGSAWTCGIAGGGTSFNCIAGDGGGAGIDTFTTQEFVKIRAEATVGAATAIGTVLTNTAVYAFGAAAPPVAPTATSNATVHVVQPTADLSIAKFVNAGGGNNGGNVIAGGTSVAYATPGVPAPAPGTGNIDYQLLIGNGGPDNGSSVIIQDAIPNNTVVVSPPALNPASVFINGVPQPTFVISCGVFAGNFIECRPGNNTALNPAWTNDVLPAGFSARLNYRVAVPANVAQGTIVQNQARISSQQTNPGPAVLSIDPNAGNNAATPVNTQVLALADLGITKVTSNATPVAGGAAFSYTLTVTNNGPSDAVNVVVNDPLPAGVIFQNVAVVNAGGAQFICSGPPNATNGTVSCTSGILPAGGTGTITIVAQIVPNVASGVRTNTATVISATTETTPNTFPNTASVQQNITVDAPLSITKAGPATVCAGDTFTYHITVNNGGSSTALNATISDPLPANTTFLSLAGTGGFTSGCSHNGGTPGTVTCAAVDIPSGLSTLDITVKLAPSAPAGPLANTATITTAGTGTIAVGTSTTTATVSRCVDLEVVKDSSPDAVLAGQDINYTITVKNIGPSDLGAGQFVVNDTTFPPTGTTLKAGTTVLAPGFSCNGTTSAATCTSTTAALPVGASATIQFTATVNANFNGGQPGGVIVNTATATVTGANITEANLSNNSSTVNTAVGPSADLSITKEALTVAGGVFGAAVTAGGNVSPGFGIGNVGLGEIEYTLTYRNSGLGDATNVHIRDVIPAGTLLDPTFLPIGVVVTPLAGPGLTCQILPTLNTYQLDCTPNTANGVLPAGANGTIQFSIRVPENILDGAVIKNVATINSEAAGATPATPDPNGGNNTSAETQNIVRTSADLAVTKTGPASVVAGNNITYTLTVTNNGVSDAQNVVVKDTLPPNVSFVSLGAGSDPRFVCTPDNGNAGIVNCTAATLIAPALNAPPIIPPRNGSNVATIIIIGKVAANVANGTVLTNNATVAASTQDPVPANNAAAPVNTTVATEAAVTIVKTDNPDPVVAGANLTYNITVTNNGPSDAQAVSVVDTLPPTTQVQFLSASGTGVFSAANSCTVNLATNVVTCTAIPGGVFPAGATANITIVVKVLSSVPPNALPQNPDDPAGLLNTATINWSDSNGVVGALVAQTATDTERTTVRHESDMAIVKNAPDFVVAGGRLDYRLVVTNNGPSDVLGDVTPGSVTIMDTLPAGVTPLLPLTPPNVIISGPGGFTCTFAAGPPGKLTCVNAAGAPGNVPAGAVVTIVFKVDVSSTLLDGTNINNCAMVTLRGAPDPTPEIDPNPGNDNSCDSTVVRTLADLAISKSATPVVDPDGAGPLAPVALPIVGPNVPPGSVNAGGYIQYDIPFGNNGPSDAINVLITDQIAGNAAFVGALATGGVFVPAAQPPAVPFVFTIQATDTVAPVGAPINLTCTVVGAPGSQQIYCRPEGNGAVPAPGPYADGVLPAGYSGTLTFFVKVNESVSGGTLVTNPANITSGLCPNGVGPVPPVFPPVACAGTPDPNPANNTTLPTSTVVVASSNLAITKIVQSAVTTASNPNQTGPIGPATAPNGAGLTGAAVLPGTLLTYRVTITNNGPSDVSNIRLTDVLPSGLETPPGRVLGVRYVSATPVLPSGATFTCAAPTGINPGNNPQQNGGSVVCTAPLLSANAPNNTAAIDITVFIDPATKASLINSATVDATLNNFNRPVSGTAVLTTPVAATSDLAVTKTISDADVNTPGVQAPPIIAGNTFQYTVVLTNNGPSAAQMVSLVDTFPAFQRVTNVAIQQTPNGNGAPNFSCTAVPAIGAPGNTTSLTCTAAELPPNRNADNTVNPSGTVTFVITVVQDPLTTQPGVPFQNCVTATSMSTDPVPANNTNVCIPIPIGFIASPTGTKVDTPDPVIAGNLLTYTITATNPGPSAALNFRIIDPLPQGTVFISAAASPGATLTTPAVGANGVVQAQWDAAGGTPAGLTPPGVTRTLTIVVRVCPDFQQIRALTDAQMCVPNLTNTATITSDTPGIAGTATSTTTVQAQSDLGITKTGPASAIANQVVTYTLTVTNAGPSNANNVLITDVLPKGFTLVPGGIVITPTGGTLGVGIPATPIGLVAGSPTTDAAGTQTVAINLGVLGAANQCGPVIYPTSVTVTLRVRVPTKHPNIVVTNAATVSSTNCLAETGTLAVQTNPLLGFPAIITPGTGMLANNRAFFDTIIGPAANDPGPGSVPGYPATAEISDQKAGSVLFFPIYTSDAANPNSQNTRMSITNISSAETACVHLYMVDGASCGVVDVFLCLTPNQTVAFTAADFDPGQTGYVVAVAVDCNTGLPIAFNCLIGDEFVKFSTGHQANLGAEAVAAVMFNPAGTDTTATTATLRFNGMNYNRLPRIVAVDNIQSRADQNDPLLIVNAIGGNFTRSGATIISLFGAVYDDAETPYSFTQNVSTCQFRSIINNNFPRMITRLETAIPAGRSGWMKFWSTADQGLLGAFINRNPNAASNSGAFNQGHNLHKLTLTDQSSIVVPVLTPACN